MFLKNLNPERGLCNGTQFIMQQIGQYVLAVKILEGQNAFELISRLTLSILPGTLSCILTRKQFLIKMSFAITINKSQGHSLKKKAAVDLQNPIFTPLRSRPILNSPTFAQYFDLVRMRSNIAVSHNTNYPSLSTCQVFSCILQAIGNYHYRFTFDKTPLDPIRVLIAVTMLNTLLFQGNDDLT